MSKRGRDYYERYNDDYSYSGAWIGRNLFLGVVISIIIALCWGGKWAYNKITHKEDVRVEVKK